LAAIVGGALLLLGMALRGLADQEGLQIILLIPTFLVVGLLATGAKRGFLLAFVMTVVFAVVNNLLFTIENLKPDNVSMAIAMLLLNVLFPALIAGVLAALGGLVGKRVFK